MPEAAFGTVAVGQFVARLPYCLKAGCHNHLADAVAALYGERNIGVVYKYNTYLAAIVSVDSTRRVEKCDAVAQSQTAAGAQLYLEAGRQLYAQSGGYEYSGAWGYDLSLIHI